MGAIDTGDFFRVTLRILLIAALLALLLFSIISRTSIFIPSENITLRSIFAIINNVGTYCFNLVTLLAMVVLVVALILDARLGRGSVLDDITRVLIAGLVAGGFILSLDLSWLHLNSSPGMNLIYLIAAGLLVPLMGLRAAGYPRRGHELPFWVLLTLAIWLSLYEPVSQYIFRLAGRIDVPPGIQYLTFAGEAALVLAFLSVVLCYWLIPQRLQQWIDTRRGWIWSLVIALLVPLAILAGNLALPGVVSLVAKFALGYNSSLPWLLYLVTIALFIFTLLRLAWGGGSAERYSAAGLFLIFSGGFQQLDSYHFMLLFTGMLILLRAHEWQQVTYPVEQMLVAGSATQAHAEQ